jgi:hypothetical protein
MDDETKVTAGDEEIENIRLDSPREIENASEENHDDVDHEHEDHEHEDHEHEDHEHSHRLCM